MQTEDTARIEETHAPSSGGYVWGVVDQGFISLSNFLLSLAVGRSFGADQLGIVFIGFSVSLIFLGLFRAMVTEPVVAISTRATKDTSSKATRSGFGVAILFGLLLSGASATLGLIFQDTATGSALLMFAPWFLPLFVHDLSRGVLFRDGRPGVAAVGSTLLFLGMSVVLMVVWQASSPFLYVAAWGLGLVAASAWGLLRMGLWPANSVESVRWWVQNAWQIARWFGSGSAVSILGTHLMPVALVVVISTSELGGLRAIQSLFAPLSLIGPAISLPGLPRIVRASSASFAQARWTAYQMSLVAAGLCSICLIVFMILGSRLLPLIYGRDFNGFLDLVLPVGIHQVLIACLVGPILLLKAHRRGRDLLMISLSLTGASLALAIPLATIADAEGATWGLCLGALAAFATTVMLTERLRRLMTESRVM